MAKEYYWRIRCDSDSKYEYEWATTKPTVCPTNGSHTIVSGDTAVTDERNSTTQTTDATTTTTFTGTPIDGETCSIHANVLARKTDGTKSARYELETLIRRSGSTTTIVGSVTKSVEIEDDSAWNATIDTSGADFRVRVTGVASTTIDWITDVAAVEIK